METWEYYAEVVAVGPGYSETEWHSRLVARLNILGADGWKLASLKQGMSGSDVVYRCVFMRPGKR